MTVYLKTNARSALGILTHPDRLFFTCDFRSSPLKDQERANLALSPCIIQYYLKINSTYLSYG